MTVQEIKEWLSAMGFAPKTGSTSTWDKSYGSESIEVLLDDNSFKDCKIKWPSSMPKAGRDTTSNLSQDETLVVLEAVDRLLVKKYKAESIILEKPWQL
jgi:hypothetical protein